MPGELASSQRPYLIRAMHEWMSDNGQTPQVVVDATAEGVDVPRQHVREGKIVLNVSHTATRALSLGNDRIEFRARFSGADHTVSVPVLAVMGIYARETGQGMIFTDENPSPPEGKPEPPPKGPHLTVVK